jgi:hypothetical protein
MARWQRLRHSVPPNRAAEVMRTSAARFIHQERLPLCSGRLVCARWCAQTGSSTYSTGLRGSIQAGDCLPDHNFPNRVRLSIPRIRQRRTCRYRKYTSYPSKCRRFLRPLKAEYEKDAGGCQDGFAKLTDSTGRDAPAESIAHWQGALQSLEDSSVVEGVEP